MFQGQQEVYLVHSNLEIIGTMKNLVENINNLIADFQKDATLQA